MRPVVAQLSATVAMCSLDGGSGSMIFDICTERVTSFVGVLIHFTSYAILAAKSFHLAQVGTRDHQRHLRAPPMRTRRASSQLKATRAPLLISNLPVSNLLKVHCRRLTKLSCDLGLWVFQLLDMKQCWSLCFTPRQHARGVVGSCDSSCLSI